MQLRSRITLAAAFFLLAPVVLFFLIDLMRDRFIASSFVERQFEDDQPFVEGFVREAQLRLEAPASEIQAILPSEQIPRSFLNPDTGTLVYEPWTTMQFRLEQIAENHAGLSFGLFDRDGQLLVSVGENVDLLAQGYDGTNRSYANGISPNADSFMVRRTMRTLRGLYVYVGALSVEEFIGNISDSVGEPVALIQRAIIENPAGVRPQDQARLGAIEVAGVGLPNATSAAPNRYESAVVFWEAVKDSALASQPRRYFTLSDGEHRGIVTEIRVEVLTPMLEEGLFVRLVRNRTLASIREEKQNRLVYGGFTVLILVSVILLLWFFNRSFRPLTDLIEALRALARHDFDYRIPHTNRRDELGALARGLTDFRSSLVDRERLVLLKEQMEFAAQIQRSILPHSFNVADFASIDAITKPAEDVGGDFFDVFMLANGNAGIVVADVADKGMGSALFGALASSLTRATARLYNCPGKVLEAVNQQLCDRNEADLFVTLFYGVMDRETGVLIYANAGHEPPLLLNRDGGGDTRVERTATTHGLPLGLVPDAKFETGSVTLRPSDNLVLFTDGITEAENAENRLFSSAALNDLLLRQSSNVPSDIISSVLEDVRAFTGEQPQSDDITLMVVRYDGVPTQKSADNKDSEESRESPKLRVVGNT
jgi:HAMP domain-containing protein